MTTYNVPPNISGQTLNSADILNVDSGGTATATINYGVENVYAGGTDNGATIEKFGNEYVYSGGTAVDTTINYGGWEYVYRGGTATGTMINGNQDVYGTATSTTINSNGNQIGDQIVERAARPPARRSTAAANTTLARPSTRRSITSAYNSYTRAARPPTR